LTADTSITHITNKHLSSIDQHHFYLILFFLSLINVWRLALFQKLLGTLG